MQTQLPPLIQANAPRVSSKSSGAPYAIRNDSVMTRGGRQGLGGTRYSHAYSFHHTSRTRPFPQRREDYAQDLIWPYNEV